MKRFLIFVSVLGVYCVGAAGAGPAHAGQGVHGPGSTSQAMDLPSWSHRPMPVDSSLVPTPAARQGVSGQAISLAESSWKPFKATRPHLTPDPIARNPLVRCPVPAKCEAVVSFSRNHQRFVGATPDAERHVVDGR